MGSILLPAVWISLALSATIWTVVLGRRDPVRRFRLDPEWSKTIERMQYDYSEVIEETTKGEELIGFDLQRWGWNLADPVISSYIALIYTNITKLVLKDSKPHSSHTVVDPSGGHSCGGILVSRTTVLTTCGCLFVWFKLTEWKTFFDKQEYLLRVLSGIGPERLFPFTIYSEYGSSYARVATYYVEPAKNYFLPSFEQKIINDFHRQSAGNMNCKNWEKRLELSDDSTEEHLALGLLLASFEPGLDDYDVTNFIPWPPIPIANLTNYYLGRPDIYPKEGTKAKVLGYGLVPRSAPVKYHDAYGTEIDLGHLLLEVDFHVIPKKECTQVFRLIDWDKLINNTEPTLFCMEMAGWDPYTIENEWGGLVNFTEPQLKGGLPGSVVTSPSGKFAGIIVDIKPSKNWRKTYFLAMNMIGLVQTFLEKDNHRLFQYRKKILRSPLYQEVGWETLFFHYAPLAQDAESILDEYEKIENKGRSDVEPETNVMSELGDISGNGQLIPSAFVIFTVVSIT